MTEQSPDCPSMESIAAYIEGNVSKEECHFISEHLGVCSNCYRTFAEVAKEEVADRSRRRIRSYGLVAGIAAVLVIAVLGARLLVKDSITSQRAVHSPGTAAYWIERSGLLTPAEEPLTLRAKKVFERVARVADQATAGKSRLIMIKGKAQPFAVALKDGSIVLSEEGLRICYGNVHPDQGDSRVAFTLAHELVHQRQQDFLHAAAFVPVEGEKISVTEEKELEADAYGLIYSTIAGYDPDPVIRADASFIQQWTSQLPYQLAYTNHPDPNERTEFVRAHLSKVVADLNFFYYGVRLYQIGRYDDSIRFLTRFAEKFPGREVFNNLGLSHYQLAVRALAGCDPSLVSRIYPATILETETFAGQFRSDMNAPCLQTDAFREQIQKAEKAFQRAMQMDPVSIAPRMNLSSVKLVVGNYVDARAVLNEAMKLHAHDPGVQNNLYLTQYLMDPEAQIDASLIAFERLLQRSPSYAPALYNHARLQFQKRLREESATTWNRFLQLESKGLYADEARNQLNRKQELQTVKSLGSPIPLGELREKSRKLLESMNRVNWSLDAVEGSFYEDAGKKVLVIDDFVEAVETTSHSEQDPSSLQQTYGIPRRTITTAAGQVRIYSNFALDIRDHRLHTIVYFN